MFNTFRRIRQAEAAGLSLKIPKERTASHPNNKDF